jgi:hypothetical protein
MSLFDHLDPQERAIAETELNDWIDRHPTLETPLPPTCGQCKHFDSNGLDIDGIRGMCRAKSELEFYTNVVLTLHPPREATDEICHLYVEAVPF